MTARRGIAAVQPPAKWKDMPTPLECVNESRHDPAARLGAGLSLPGARSEMGLIDSDRLPGIRSNAQPMRQSVLVVAYDGR